MNCSYVQLSLAHSVLLELGLGTIEADLDIFDDISGLKRRQDDVDEPQEEQERARQIARQGRTAELASNAL